MRNCDFTSCRRFSPNLCPTANNPLRCDLKFRIQGCSTSRDTYPPDGFLLIPRTRISGTLPLRPADPLVVLTCQSNHPLGSHYRAPYTSFRLKDSPLSISEKLDFRPVIDWSGTFVNVLLEDAVLHITLAASAGRTRSTRSCEARA